MSPQYIYQKPVLRRLRPKERRSILLLGDLIVAGISLFFALYIWANQDAWFGFSWQFLLERPPLWFYLMPVLWLLLLTETYDDQRSNHRKETVLGIGFAATISFGLYLIVYFTSTPNSLPRQGVAAFIVSASLLTIAWRLLYINIFTAPLFMRRVMIVGAGVTGSALAGVIHSMWPPPFLLVGFIDDDPDKIGAANEDCPILGNSTEMLDIVEGEAITDLVCAISGDMQPDMFQNLLSAEECGVQVTTMPTMYEELLGRVPISLLRSDWILRSFVDQAHMGEFYEISKRMVDILGALVGIIILAVLFPFIALATYLDSGRPIFYLQDRLGKNGRVYKIFKFRTMRQDAEKDGKARPAAENDDRITRVGKFLRKSHLDEFPQFINVLLGSMSLVGPRAERLELVHNLQMKVPFYRARLLVKPGLTGWAQINFGYASTVEETSIKLEYDLYYIKQRTLLLDVVILLRTLGTVLGFRGQ